MPKVLIFAGANGSGKTTFASSIIEPNIRFINADEIEKEEGISYLEASKKSLHLIDDSILKGIDFSFETTMSGKGLLKRFTLLKNGDYDIVIFYLFVYPIDLLVERIKERVKKGGHMVSDRDVIRRYYRSICNFWKKYRFYANEWNIVNNNELEPKGIVIGGKKDFKIIDNLEFNVFKEALKNAQNQA